ncbi:hypothetical protein V6N13_050987 [Hibiscus sabdariffa]|uniref:Uncharacterized protein n=1 Tax=Hibiscus sabdariffa TaxID=183260 RepID=A0ABR2T323_9ROSI
MMAQVYKGVGSGAPSATSSSSASSRKSLSTGEEKEDPILDLLNFSALVENCKTYMEVFQEVAESQNSKEENKDTYVAAESLEKLNMPKLKQNIC